ncbi:MAG: hypothetical protein O2954_11015 [bacterium]|nr:hypothetical protein [bacterium]
MLPIALVLLLIGFLIFRLTSGRFSQEKRSAVPESKRYASGVGEAASKALQLPALKGRPVVLGEVVYELMERLGVDRETAEEELRRMGLAVEAEEVDGAPLEGRLTVYRSGDGLRELLEQALLVGIQVARYDDDYERVGDEFLDIETLSQRAETVEVNLFGEGRRERYTLCGKASLVLQDMLQGNAGEEKKEVIRCLLQVFDGELESLQQELAQAMGSVPDPGGLLWGSSQDRRLYYFKMGVTNSLRRSGRLESLGHMYRLRGVDYDVQEAYELAAQECPQLFLAGEIGIDRLLQMGPLEVRGLVGRALPESEN